MDGRQASWAICSTCIAIKLAIHVCLFFGLETWDLRCHLLVVVIDTSSVVVQLINAWFSLLLLCFFLLCIYLLFLLSTVMRFTLFGFWINIWTCSFGQNVFLFERSWTRVRTTSVGKLAVSWFWKRNRFRQDCGGRGRRFCCRSCLPLRLYHRVFRCSHLFLLSFIVVSFTAALTFLIVRELLTNHKPIVSDILQVSFHVSHKFIERLYTFVYFLFAHAWYYLFLNTFCSIRWSLVMRWL